MVVPWRNEIPLEKTSFKLKQIKKKKCLTVTADNVSVNTVKRCPLVEKV